MRDSSRGVQVPSKSDNKKTSFLFFFFLKYPSTLHVNTRKFLHSKFSDDNITITVVSMSRMEGVGCETFWNRSLEDCFS